MKPLTSFFNPQTDFKIPRPSEPAENSWDGSDVRAKLRDCGVLFQGYTPQPKPCFTALACDASILKSEKRYAGVWACHSVAVYAETKGKRERDVYTGLGEIIYGNMKYESRLSCGFFEPYEALEDRLDSIRFVKEAKALCESEADADYLFFDGSLKSAGEKMGGKRIYPEQCEAKKHYKKLLGENVAALVEDTRSSELSKKLGLNTTDLLLFENILGEGEFAAFDEDPVVVYAM
ncbi:MAG: hypothetical protein GF334_11395, partial [Candidatus Altiarchaeales archaeon]|nr:hypothetical protein [Candidatus Altiarchaeales archaeon]